MILDLLAHPFLLPGILLMGGLYLACTEPPNTAKSGFVRLRKITAFGSLLVGVGALALAIMTPKLEIAWEPFSHERLVEAKADGEPVVIDFYADWCSGCKLLDRFVFSNQEVVEEMHHFVTLRADLSDQRNQAVTDLAEEYQLRGVPTVVFIDPFGYEFQEARLVGVVRSKDMLRILRSSRLRGNR